MNKKLIRLTESDLHRIVKESVQKILRESKEYEQKRIYKIIDPSKETMDSLNRTRIDIDRQIMNSRWDGFDGDVFIDIHGGLVKVSATNDVDIDKIYGYLVKGGKLELVDSI